jgi:hypothetical protein
MIGFYAAGWPVRQQGRPRLSRAAYRMRFSMRTHAKGDRVAQPQYGLGTVVEANDRHIIIEFDEHGRRTFVTAMVSLESSAEPAPTKTRRSPRKSKA